MKKLIILSALHFAALSASAASCGTVAAPLTCTLTAGQVQYLFSNFSLVANGATGGAPLATSGDIGLELIPGGGLSATLEFRKLVTQDNPSIVFFANSGGVSAFTLS